jgi:hypothetical protein
VVQVQEIEGQHAEAAIMSVKMQPVKIWQSCGVARREFAVDDEGPHAEQHAIACGGW